MVRVSDELALSLDDQLTLYHTTDPKLGHVPILIFYGPSTTVNSTLNSSRIQVHIFTALGFQSYPRLTISPTSPFYNAVSHLPREKQGDEICRGLAFGLLKYFKDVPDVAKSSLIIQSSQSRNRRPGPAPALFGELHVADLVSSMTAVDNIADVAECIEAAFLPQNIAHFDVDLVLPPGCIGQLREEASDQYEQEVSDPVLERYGTYSRLVKQFGEVAFLPTSRLRRAPSKPSALNRSKSLLRDQKVSLRLEMGELVDTEERYVIKMHDLVNNMAEEFRASAKSRSAGSLSPTEQDLQKLFPRCLDQILKVNSSFLQEIRKVMDSSEQDAMRDLETPLVNSTGSRHGETGRPRDRTGVLAFAKLLLEWFPRFSDCYQEYIRASQEFPQIISKYLSQQSSFSKRVQQSGEQRLRSIVIEPVQRLPRYSLFIDNIVGHLPVNHPALNLLLKARDIITEICSLDPPASDGLQVVNRLRKLVEFWPSTLLPQSRLITAIDVVELQPPFFPGSFTEGSKDGILLLFSECIVLLKKSRECNLSARGVLAEVDKPTAATMMASMTPIAGGQNNEYGLSFAGWHNLADTRYTTSDDGKIIWMISSHELRDSGFGQDRNASAITIRTFILQGSYEGKGTKLTEEVTKARIEGRFSEGERENDKWCLRSTYLGNPGINLHTAVFEEGLDTLIEGRKEPAPIRIVVDYEKGTKGAPVGHYGVEMIVNLIMSEDGSKCRLETEGLSGKVTVDVVSIDDCLLAIAKRITTLLDTQHGTSNSTLAPPLISFNSKILRSIHYVMGDEKIKSFRPTSPVKMLSNLLTGGFSNATPSGHGSVSKSQRTPLLGAIPAIAPSLSRSGSNKSTHSIQSLDGRASVIATNDVIQPANPIVRLEETLKGYIVALYSRKGSIVGRSLRNRGSADELAINALYNSFIENPYDNRAVSEASAEVIFVAFEKFVRIAWKAQMGLVISSQTLDSLQGKAQKLAAGDFAEYVRNVLGEIAPQNSRAFISIIQLLSALLEGCGSDADRGTLTAAFSELLVLDGDPHDYINLLDRLVEDSDVLFDEIGLEEVEQFMRTSHKGSISGHRSNPSASGSLTSNASSLRRRFADTLLRQNSYKNDSESRTSVWRTLSKTNRTEQIEPSSLSKASLNRSRSIESPSRRPVSRDRPGIMGLFDTSRPSSSNSQQMRLPTIDGSPKEDKELPKTPRSKRRSSLSDLRSLLAATTLGSSPSMLGSPTPQPERKSQETIKLNSSPRTPSPTKIPAVGSIMDRPRSMMYPTAYSYKENVASNSVIRNTGGLTERPHNIMSQLENSAAKDAASSLKSHSKSASASSNIPTLRGVPRERTPSVSRPTTSATKPSSQKLRLHNSQKLRERLQSESSAINDADQSLQNELSKIGQEMARLHSTPISKLEEMQEISTKVNALNEKVSKIFEALNGHNESIRKDMETTLQATEFKLKGLDQLYKESSAENELLYEKFNGELGKIVKALKGKGKEDKEDLISKVKEASEDVAKTKKENARLRREILSLRTLMKANE